jgi:hypothetical protein
VDDGEVLRYEITSDQPAEDLGDLIPGGNPALAQG